MTDLNTFVAQFVTITFTSKIWSFCQWITSLLYFEKLPLVKDSLLKLFSADNFWAMTLLVLSVYVCVCVVTNSVRHTADLRTQALSGLEMVGAGVNSGSLATAEWLWAVASGLRYFLNGNPRLFLATFSMRCWRHCQGRHTVPPFWVTSFWLICVCVKRFVYL